MVQYIPHIVVYIPLSGIYKQVSKHLKPIVTNENTIDFNIISFSDQFEYNARRYTITN